MRAARRVLRLGHAVIAASGSTNRALAGGLPSEQQRGTFGAAQEPYSPRSLVVATSSPPAAIDAASQLAPLLALTAPRPFLAVTAGGVQDLRGGRAAAAAGRRQRGEGGGGGGAELS